MSGSIAPEERGGPSIDVTMLLTDVEHLFYEIDSLLYEVYNSMYDDQREAFAVSTGMCTAL